MVIALCILSGLLAISIGVTTLVIFGTRADLKDLALIEQRLRESRTENEVLRGRLEESRNDNDRLTQQVASKCGRLIKQYLEMKEPTVPTTSDSDNLKRFLNL